MPWKRRRARKLHHGWVQEDPATGFTVYEGCITERWDNDLPFRKTQEALHYAREDMEEWDEVAESPGQAPPRKGEGRTRQTREQTEGLYERVSRPGHQPDTAMTQQPEFVHHRNAVRRARPLFDEESNRRQAPDRRAMAERGRKRAPGNQTPPKSAETLT